MQRVFFLFPQLDVFKRDGATRGGRVNQTRGREGGEGVMSGGG